MYTLRETPIYTKMVDSLLSLEEQGELNAFIASHADAGDVIQSSGGCRKIRWKQAGKGKSGSVRIIYFNQLEDGLITLLLIYTKSNLDTIPSHKLRQIKQELTK